MVIPEHKMKMISSFGNVYICGHINGVQVPMSLNTGSTATFLSAELWRKMCTSDPSLSVLKGVDCLPSVVDGKGNILGCFSGTFHFGRKKRVHPLIVIDGLPEQQSCLLGTDFFEKFGCLLNYRRNIMYIGKEKIAMLRKRPREIRVSSKSGRNADLQSAVCEAKPVKLSPYVPTLGIAKAQAEDPDIAPVLDLLKLDKEPPEEQVKHLGTSVIVNSGSLSYVDCG